MFHSAGTTRMVPTLMATKGRTAPSSWRPGLQMGASRASTATST